MLTVDGCPFQQLAGRHHAVKFRMGHKKVVPPFALTWSPRAGSGGDAELVFRALTSHFRQDRGFAHCCGPSDDHQCPLSTVRP